MGKYKDKIRPITVIKTQWKGWTTKHYWVAFDAHISEIPPSIGINSEFEKEFFSTEVSKSYTYAFGTSPGSALMALQRAGK